MYLKLIEPKRSVKIVAVTNIFAAPYMARGNFYREIIMKKLIKDFTSAVKGFNTYSKYFIRCGVPLIFGAYLSAAYCFITAGKFSAYDATVRLGFELLACGKELIGAIMLPALFLEILFLAEKIDGN